MKCKAGGRVLKRLLNLQKPQDRGWLTGRANANGVDLNRDFPDLDSLYYYFEQNKVPRYDHLLELFSDEKQVINDLS